MEGIVRAWGRILAGYRPSLSIEITRECPLRCPGCYAYGAEHLGGERTLSDLADRKGQALIDGILEAVDRFNPLHVSLVGGEPLVRYRELDVVLPRLAERGLYVQVVTSAVRPIPIAWAAIPRLQICVSIDGLQPEHDARRTPATYARILKHIEGQRITVHCTVTRQQSARDGYLEEFVATWSANPNVRTIWMSLYTPQVGEASGERLTPIDRAPRCRRARPPAHALPEAPDAGAATGRLPGSAGVTGRLHLRADHGLPVRGLRDPNHTVPVRWHAGLRELWLHGLRGSRGGRATSTGRRGSDRSRCFAARCASGGRSATCAGVGRHDERGAVEGLLHARADVVLAQPPVKVCFPHRPGGLRRGPADDQRPPLFL